MLFKRTKQTGWRSIFSPIWHAKHVNQIQMKSICVYSTQKNILIHIWLSSAFFIYFVIQSLENSIFLLKNRTIYRSYFLDSEKKRKKNDENKSKAKWNVRSNWNVTSYIQRKTQIWARVWLNGQFSIFLSRFPTRRRWEKNRIEDFGQQHLTQHRLCGVS